MGNRIAIDGWNTVQPSTFDYDFQTTSSSDSGRTMSGKANVSVLFTVEAFTVEYRNLTPNQASAILQRIVQTPSKPYFSLYYFSPYYGQWRTAQFYVGEGSLKIKTLEQGSENIDSISCSFVGRNKLC